MFGRMCFCYAGLWRFWRWISLIFCERGYSYANIVGFTHTNSHFNTDPHLNTYTDFNSYRYAIW
jgi:hypothetical protein